MKVFNPLAEDHPLVTDSIRCVLCAARFIPNDRATLLVPASDSGKETGLPVHASCVVFALQGVCEPPPHEIALDDPSLPAEQRALQQRYSDAITMLMIDQMKPDEVGCCIAMTNALIAHALIGLRVLNRTGTIKPGELDRVVQRFKLALQSPQNVS